MNLNGTPTYQENIFHKVSALMQQFGILIFFLALPCGDMSVNELMWILSKLNYLNISDEDVRRTPYKERCYLKI